MKVFKSSEIRSLEQCAADSSISLESLMEKAGNTVALFTARQADVKEKNIVILCGKGNNGGDGFVASGVLANLGAKVTVVLTHGKPTTDIAKNAFEKIPSSVNIIDWSEKKTAIETIILKSNFIIDAIFGIGFKGDVDESTEKIFSICNKSFAIKIAVDLPSGTHCDTGKVASTCFKADFTIAFTSIKPANVLFPASSFCGKSVVASVGIPKNLIDSLPASFSVKKESSIIPLFKKRKLDSHKGTYGTLVMICGSYGMIGAAYMCAKAALRSGVGLLNMVVNKDCYSILAGLVPEAVFTIMDFSTTDAATKSSEALFKVMKKATACVIGCGLGDDASNYVPTVIKYASCPVVVDADAINYLAQNKSLLKQASSALILTPHTGEMSRLCGKTTVQVNLDKIATVTKFSREFNVFTVLKGFGTIIASPKGEVSLNTTGNPGMATGGSGDALAGIIGSLLAQEFSVFDASTAGVYIHGRAGDLCANELSQTSMLPTDLIEYLPKVFKSIEDKL